MVPELEALEARGYFSRAEIRSIVQRRQEFEYALKRMAALKGDYLRYIAYEGQLEELREARRASRAISGKKSLAEFCIVRRMHFIYERATRKFRCARRGQWGNGAAGQRQETGQGRACAAAATAAGGCSGSGGWRKTTQPSTVSTPACCPALPAAGATWTSGPAGCASASRRAATVRCPRC